MSAGQRRTIVSCGVTALVGCVLVVLANFIGVLVIDDHNPISDTISNLAIGNYGWIQDIGLNIFAVGIFALSVGLYLGLSGGWRFKSGVVLLILLSIDVLLISEHDQYAGRPGRGASIHIYCVYALYGLFILIPFFLSKSLKAWGDRWRFFSLGIAAGWFVLASLFFIVPDSWDGGYERFLALFLLAWVGSLGWQLRNAYK
jgi:hypothetical protein